jgi:hypothetical protein
MIAKNDFKLLYNYIKDIRKNYSIESIIVSGNSIQIYKGKRIHEENKTTITVEGNIYDYYIVFINGKKLNLSNRQSRKIKRIFYKTLNYFKNIQNEIDSNKLLKEAEIIISDLKTDNGEKSGQLSIVDHGGELSIAK